jgi:pimeloyl-ACP methyl ester carboxylesterase
MSSDPTELNRVPADERKPDVIAVHGFIQTLVSWRHLVPKLAARGKRTCLFDLKGHGGSPCPADQRYSLENHAAPILAFIRDNDLRDLTLIGHSFGGSVALLLAIRLAREGRLRALVIIDGFLDASALRIRLLRAFGLAGGPLAAPVFRWEPLARFAVRLGLWMLCRHPERFEDSAVAAYAANLSRQDHAQALIATGRFILDAEYAALRAKLPTIDVPTLIVRGAQDRLLAPASADRLHAAIPQSELFRVEDCGHIPHEERPEIVVEKIAAFVVAQAAARVIV